MQTGEREIREGAAYERFFTPAKGETITIKKKAELGDTLEWLKIVIDRTLEQTEQLANHLKASTLTETCKRIWEFGFNHFQYTRDESRKEQIRTPNRAWIDRKAGIDCDCFTVLICSVLKNLNIPHAMRITKYTAPEFEHIYPVVFTPNQKEIIIDCVVHEFNYEVPYIEKKDIKMELEILNGMGDDHFDDNSESINFDNDLPMDAQDLFLDNDMELDGLEGRAEREARRAARKVKRARPKAVKKTERKAKRQAFVKSFKEGSLKEKIRSGLHVINKINPAAVALRAGILASMKLNLFKVASKLRFGYWTPTQASANQMDMAKFNQLQRIRERLEKTYFRAGGKPGKLKTAILTGRGNRNKMVNLNGLGSITSLPSDDDSLRDILGEELYHDELNGIEGLGALGEPATAAVVAAASGAIGIIAGLLKKLGSLFKKGSKADQQFQIQDNTENAEEKTRRFSLKKMVNNVRSNIQRRNGSQPFSLQPQSSGGDGNFMMTQGSETGGDSFTQNTSFSEGEPFNELANRNAIAPAFSPDDEDEKRGFGQWLKDNKVSVGIGAGVIAAGTAIAIYLKRKGKKRKAINGLAGSKKGKKKKKSAKYPVRRKTAITRKKKPFTPRSRGRKKPRTATRARKPVIKEMM